MNRVSLIFLGAFSALAVSFTCVVLSNQLSYGALSTYFDEGENKVFPQAVTGLAEQGKRVYQDLGCVACHTQQVQRTDIAPDVARGWGERMSVARDYVRESRVLLGESRLGPDLRNVGARLTDAGALYQYLYNPETVTPGTLQPSYRFLFTTKKIVGEPSSKALSIKGVTVPVGYEIIPSPRAEALVSYLLSLKDSYPYPEAKNVYVAKDAVKLEGNK